MIVSSSNPDVKDMHGLHLFHGDISNCSMRVRMALNEKGLPWVSHHIDLRKKENISDYYFAIHPKGLVPCLVDDGVVHIESNEIIDYLDKKFPEPRLRPADGEQERLMLELLQLAADLHLPAVKPFIYARKVAPLLAKSAEEQAKYDQIQTDTGLKDFHKKHAEGKQFGEDEVEKAIERLNAAFGRLEGMLSDGRPWLLGSSFTLADIAWSPLYFTLNGAGFDFTPFPNVIGWMKRLEARDSYRTGITDWCEDFAKI